MSKSFIPRDTCVVCTNMTVAKPLKLAHEHGSTAFYKSEERQLLNINDRKITDTFVCKNPAKFWKGLGMMLVGVAIGILVGALAVALVVGTAGMALGPIAILASAAFVGGAGCVIAGEVKSHDCDVTKSGTWKLVHETVYIDKQKALLQTSVLSCSQGGIVSIVPDPVLAQQYATNYAENNNKEVNRHVQSQLFQGLITGFTFLGNPLGAIIGMSLGTTFYALGENDSQDNQRKMLNDEVTEPRTLGGDLASSGKQEAINQATGFGAEATKVKIQRSSATSQSQLRQAAHFERQAAEQEARAARLAANGADEQAANVARRAANSRFAASVARRSPPTLFNKSFFVGFGIGIAGAVGNFAIEYSANKAEDESFDNVRGNLRDISISNTLKKNGIDITALKG